MKFIITMVLIGLISILPVSPVYTSIAEAPLREPTIEELVAQSASYYHVSESEMWRIMKCENKELDPKLQSRIIYNFSDPKRGIVKGEREMSYGLVQIHLPDHKNISYEQATDPAFSIDYLAEQLSLGHGSQWSCY